MKVTITGTSSGIGLELYRKLDEFYEVISINRNDLDLSIIEDVVEYEMLVTDILVNCAGTDIGGKVPFIEHNTKDMVDVINTNFVSPVILTQKALQKNPDTRIINVSSNNITRYWPNDLSYTLSKSALSIFGDLMLLEDIKVQSISPGLTKTNFNEARHRNNHKPITDIYSNKHLTADYVADRIIEMINNPELKNIVVTP